MPKADSMTVAIMAPILKNPLGCEFDANLVRPGGYDSIGALVNDLVSKLLRKSARGGLS